MGGIFGDGGGTTYVPSTTTIESTQAEAPTQADAAENDTDSRAKALAAAGDENVNTSPLGDTSTPTVKKKQLGGF